MMRQWKSAVRKYQEFMVLPITGVANMTTIKQLLSSAGDTGRDALACDTATILTSSLAQAVKRAEFDYVGRYLTGNVGDGDGGVRSKALTREELGNIVNAGLKVFPIYEDGGYNPDYTFTRPVVQVELISQQTLPLNTREPVHLKISVSYTIDNTQDPDDPDFEPVPVSKPIFTWETTKQLAVADLVLGFVIIGTVLAFVSGAGEVAVGVTAAVVAIGSLVSAAKDLIS
ncbi:peptidoglycan hydrolase-like protein with peptidoglycan-binding domain [Pullulanibacillus pueri]|nr:peptidoglycan hydrolase-like protein with peptidoglycan-binding domain [Pullulanibacillus pueri]